MILGQFRPFLPKIDQTFTDPGSYKLRKNDEIQKKTSRLAGSLDFRPFLSQRNCQNTDLNNQSAESRRTPKMPEKGHTHGKN